MERWWKACCPPLLGLLKICIPLMGLLETLRDPWNTVWETLIADLWGLFQLELWEILCRLSNPLYSYFSHFPSIYFFGQNHGLWLCVRGHLGKIIIYSNVQPIYFGLFGACFSWQGGNKFPKSTLKLGLEKVSVQVRKRRQRKLPSWAKLGAVNSNNFQLPSPHSPFGTQGQVHALERMAGVDAVGFGFTACENLLLGRHLQLQHDCLWLPRSIRKEEGRGPSCSQSQCERQGFDAPWVRNWFGGDSEGG